MWSDFNIKKSKHNRFNFNDILSNIIKTKNFDYFFDFINEDDRYYIDDQ